MKMKEQVTDGGIEYVMTCSGCRDIVVLDYTYGKCRKITVVKGVDCLLDPRNPLRMRTCLKIEYENGKTRTASTWPILALMLGQVHCYAEDGRPGFLCNKQVVAAIGKAIADLNPFLQEIELPSEDEAERIIEELQIPMPPMAWKEAETQRPDIEMEWMKRWKQSGKLCYMEDLGQYEIESAVAADRREYIGKYGEAVILETMGE